MVLAFLSGTSCSQTSRPFQPKDNDWVEQGNADWTFRGGEITGTAKEQEGYLITRGTYRDFTLELEFFPDSTVNSGIFVLCEGYEMNPLACREVNIWDRHPNQQYRTGTIVARTEPVVTVPTIGKWNTYRIESRSDSLHVFLNGNLTAREAIGGVGAGHIGLQASGTGRVRFRQVRLRYGAGSHSVFQGNRGT